MFIFKELLEQKLITVLFLLGQWLSFSFFCPSHTQYDFYIGFLNQASRITPIEILTQLYSLQLPGLYSLIFNSMYYLF